MRTERASLLDEPIEKYGLTNAAQPIGIRLWPGRPCIVRCTATRIVDSSRQPDPRPRYIAMRYATPIAYSVPKIC